MLPMDRFRELVGPDTRLSEEELRELRQQLHSLAKILVDLASDRLTRHLVRQESPEAEADTEVQ